MRILYCLCFSLVCVCHLLRQVPVHATRNANLDCLQWTKHALMITSGEKVNLNLENRKRGGGEKTRETKRTINELDSCI